MTEKHKFTHRLLAFVLCFALVLPMCTTGFAGLDEVLGGLFLKAEAATFSANSHTSLVAAIQDANAASGQSIISISGSFTEGGVSALPPITGNVILDLNGKSINYIYETAVSHSDSSNYQLPIENAGQNVMSNTNPTTLFTVNEGATLQIINSGSGKGQIYLKTQYTCDGKNNASSSHKIMQTASYLLSSKGTLILGDSKDSVNNNFMLKTVTRAARTGDNALGYNTASSAAMTVSLRGNSIFKMYGGEILSEANARSKGARDVASICYPLNIQSCKSAEIYGGTISITNNEGIECGIRNNGTADSTGGTSYFAAIRANSSNVFVFDVTSGVYAYVGSDTGKATLNAANIYATSGNTPYVFGGQFSNTADSSSSNAGTLNKYLFQGSIKRPLMDNYTGWETVTDVTTEDISASLTYFSMVYMGDEYTENDAWYGAYPTVVDWFSNFKNFYRGLYGYHEVNNWDINKTLAPNTNTGGVLPMSYERTAYTHTGWRAVFAGSNKAVDGTSISPETFGGTGGTVFVHPTWTPVRYTIVYHPEGGKIDGALHTDGYLVSYTIESTDTMPLPTRDGYTFTGWKTTDTAGNWLNVNETERTYSAGTALTGFWGDTNLYAQWEPIPYTIDFLYEAGKDADNNPIYETAQESITYNITDESVELGNPDANGPIKPGYTFDNGWTIQSWDAHTFASGAVFGNELPTGTWGNLVLVANLRPNSYSVSFNLNGGDSAALADKAVTFDAAYGTLPTPTRVGYGFAGWYTEAEGGTQVTAETLYTTVGDSTLYAHWIADAYTLSFYYNYGTMGKYIDKAINYDQPYKDVFPTDPARDGYEFLGWYTAADDSGTKIDPKADEPVLYKMTGNSSLYAHWDIITYELTFDSDGDGAADFTRSYTINDSITFPEATKTGYSYYWKADENVGSWKNNQQYHAMEYNTDHKSFGSVSFTAQWTPIQYPITYITDGGTIEAADFKSFYTIVEGVTLPTPRKTGYAFLGWVVTAVEDGGSIVADAENVIANSVIPAGSWGAVTVKAKWKAIGYTLSFNLNGGSYNGEDAYSSVYTIEDTIPLIVPTRTAYRFNGWEVSAVDENGHNWYLGDHVAADAVLQGKYGAVTLLAKWLPEVYTMHFNSDGGSTIANRNYNITEGNVLPSSTKNGYTFLGWKPDADAGSWDANTTYPAETSPVGMYGEVTFTAQWKVADFTATLDANGGTLAEGEASVNYTIQADAELPAPVRDGYDFAGWRVVEAIGSWAEGTVISSIETGNFGNVSLAAQWTLNKYDATFYSLDTLQTDLTVEDYDVTTGLTLPAPTSREHYDFAGWQPAESVGNWDASLTYQAGEYPGKWGTVRFNAVWTVQSYTVTWKIGDATETTTVEYGKMPAYDETPTMDSDGTYSYTFVGWDKELAPVDGNITYTAVFSRTLLDPDVIPEKYIATLIYNNGQAFKDIEYSPNGSVSLPTPDERSGYTFAGWKPSATVGNWNADSTYSGEQTNMTGDVVLIAQWEAIEYTLSIYPANGDANYDILYTINGNNILPNVTREGYTFTGWYVLLGEGSWSQGQVLSLNEALSGKYGNLTVQAQWQINRYTLTWIVDGTSSTETYAYGAAVPQRSVPAKLGYTAAWNIGTLPQTMPARNLTITAVYTLRAYTITYNANGGTMPAEYPTTYDITSAEALPIPTRQGSLFAGWQVVSEGGNWVLNTTTAANTLLTGRYGNVSLKAVWTPTIHVITWVINGVERNTRWYYGAVPSYDGTPVQNADAQYTYTFSHWEDVNGVEGVVSVTGDAKYIAVFDKTERIYTVTWMRDNTVLLEQKYTYGETPVYDGATPQKAPTELLEFEFIGWSSQLTDEDGVLDDEITPVTGAVTYYAQFNVYRHVQSVVLNYSNISLVNGNTLQLTASVYPLDATTPDVVWYSTNDSVATVDANGFVTAVGIGTTDICVRSVENPAASAFCTVRVTPIYVSWLEIVAHSGTSLPVGQTVQLDCIVRPENATNTNVNWVSMNSNVAVVGSTGLVTIIGPGTTEIYCYSADGYCTGSITVTGTGEVVEEPEEQYVIVWFPASTAAGGFIVNEQTIEDGTVRIPYGSDIMFKIVNSNAAYAVKVNGQGAYYPDENGYYTIQNVTSDISILVFTSNNSSLDDEITNDPDAGKSFFQRLGEFFRRIVLWFRSLFGME